jgi:hypothetical protein
MMNLACSRVRICFFGKLPNRFHHFVDWHRRSVNRRFDIVDVRRPLAIGADLAVVDQVLAPAEMPTALSSVPRYADIARRLVLASRLLSRAAPAFILTAPAGLAGAKFPATSCLGAFWTPAS